MSGASTTFQAGSRWEVTDAILRSLQANLQKNADAESDKLACKIGELEGEEYAGSGVLLRIPTIQELDIKMDPQALVHPGNMPAVFVGGGGPTTPIDAEDTQMGRQAFSDTMVEVAAYVSTQAVYQGIAYALTERELTYVAGALGGAIMNTLRTGGQNSPWQLAAGIVNTPVLGLDINGYTTQDDTKTTAAKILVTLRIGHEMRY